MIEQRLIDRIEVIEIFQNFIKGNDTIRVLRITGDTKMGKSRLLREFVKIGNGPYNIKCILLDLRSQMQSCDDIMHSIVQTIGFEHFSEYEKIYDAIYNNPRLEVTKVNQWFSSISIKGDVNRSEFQIKRLLAAFTSDLRKFVQNNKVILMFDAFEEASNEIQRWVNDKLVANICNLPQSYVILAGRKLPTPLVSWQDVVSNHHLSAVTIEHHRDFCEKIGVPINEETIEAFHLVVDGNPGLFVEFVSTFVMRKYGN